MDGHYPPHIPPVGAYYAPNPALMYPTEMLHDPRLGQLPTLSMESLGNYSDYEDPARTMMPHSAHGQPRQRRRHPNSADHVKHRRTRSGCYTCRSRRVKCDETHPICDRCRKGKRECSYPGAPSSASSSKPSRPPKAKGSLPDSGSSPSTDDDELDSRSPLAAIADDDAEYDDDEPLSGASDVPRQEGEQTSKLVSETIDGEAGRDGGVGRPSTLRTGSKHSTKQSISQNARWAKLKPDVKAYLKYHRHSMSHHHYGFKHDGGDFLKTTFLEIAMNDDSEALLYAVVAFAAYHHTINKPGTRISTFLGYYNSAISLLQQALKKKRHSVTTLLTILQLATIEEFLGDWVNLLGHQKAAHQILTDLFTPRTIMQDETRRKIIGWYIRFDLFAGIMSGGETVLGREWFDVSVEHYKRQARDRPDDLGARYEAYFATSRLLATDSALLMAAKTSGSLSDEQFITKAAALRKLFDEFRQTIETAFVDDDDFVKSFSGPRPDNDIIDIDDPKFFYDGDLYDMNFVLLDFWSIDLLFQYQYLLALGQTPTTPAISTMAVKSAKIIAGIEAYNKGPPGAILSCQASLGVVGLFLPKDTKYSDWCRRKYALVESKGYIYPATLRERMSGIWGVDVTHWWLPHDEGLPDIIRSLREFIAFRKRMPADAWGADVRDMNGIFRAMGVSDEHNIPESLKDLAAQDPSAFSISLDAPMNWDSSPDHPWSE